MNTYSQKNKLFYMNIKDITAELPDLKNCKDQKFRVIAQWLINWLQESTKAGKIGQNYVLPSKKDFAYLLGVSIGTMQNAIRYVEDLGYVESKQCIGTIIKNYDENKVKKFSSKREHAAETIKRFIFSTDIAVGQALPSSRFLAQKLKLSQNTIRGALELLNLNNIITKNIESRTWILKTRNFSVNIQKNKSTLVNDIVSKLSEYIQNNSKIGEKIPVHSELAKELKTSIKSIHDAINILTGKGILLPKRGRYGTFVIKMPNSKDSNNSRPETSIFAPAQQVAFYHYEKIQNHIKRMIVNDYQIGDKLPSIQEISKSLDVSPNTIRKALHDLADDGIVVFSRGRYGGTFIIDIPDIEQHSFKWLAVNPQYSKNLTSVN